MSWDAHVGKLVAGGSVYAAAILRPDGKKVYAQTAEMGLAERLVPVADAESSNAPAVVDEAKGVAEAVASVGKVRNGLWINGIRYHLLHWDPERNLGYYKCLNGGATIVRTAKTIIVGVWSQEKNNSQSGGQCNVAVEKLADDFRKINY